MSELPAKPWRHERKFRAALPQWMRAAASCRRLMAMDPHAGPDGNYFIRSVYMDSAGGGDFADNALGALARKKIRVRVYSKQPDYAVLERKSKIGAWNRKERIELGIDDAQAIVAGNYGLLPRIGTEAAMRFYADMVGGCYRATACVEYEREAYVLPFEDIRVTFDKAVRYSVADLGLAGEKNATPLFSDGGAIVEVKYDAEFPRWLAQVLGTLDEVQVAASKYGLSLAPWRWTP